MLTKDENIVIVEIGVQYKKSNPVNYLLEASTPDDAQTGQVTQSTTRMYIAPSRQGFIALIRSCVYDPITTQHLPSQDQRIAKADVRTGHAKAIKEGSRDLYEDQPTVVGTVTHKPLLHRWHDGEEGHATQQVTLNGDAREDDARRCSTILMARTQDVENGEEKLKSIVSKIPLENRMTTPEEIADTCLFTISEKSSHTTGQFICCDGGYVHLDRSLLTE